MKPPSLHYLFPLVVVIMFCSREDEYPLAKTTPALTEANSAFNQILSDNVDSSGYVNYRAIRENPFALEKFLDFIRNVSPENSPELFSSENEREAYWINAYNALVMNVIIDHPEIAGIKEIEWGNGVFWHKQFEVGGRKTTLNTIEKTLRKKFNDPRIHFAINCGSASCPPLGRRIFTGKDLNSRLNQRAAEFINEPSSVRIDKRYKIIYLSRIFSWYRKDFEQDGQSLLSYLDRYSRSLKLQSNPERKSWKIRFMDYDWSLNQSR